MRLALLILSSSVAFGVFWLLTFVLVVGPAVWSRDPARRRDARYVLRMIFDFLKQVVVRK